MSTEKQTSIEKANKYFKGNCNCSQSVFAAFAPQLSLSQELALKIASPFGGGMAHMDEACGAVTGGLMVIGLKYGMSNLEDLDAKERTYEIAEQFLNNLQRLTDHCDALN